MITLTQLTTRRYLPDGSPKPHWIANMGKPPAVRRTEKYDLIFRAPLAAKQDDADLSEWIWANKHRYPDNIIAIRWLKEE